MRFSNYNIVSPKLNNGDYVVLNSMAGTLDLIDTEAHDLMMTHAEDDALDDDILQLFGEVKDHFVERGYLTDLSHQEELEKAKDFAHQLIDKQNTDMWDVVLVPNMGCNYRCTYCFEQGTGYPNLTMTYDQVDAVFKLIQNRITPGENITLYGGEPLVKENKELVRYIVDKSAELENTLFTVTNGHDLEHYLDLIGSTKISTLQITVDGPREIHDKRRISLDGVSSYDKILSNIEAVLQETDAAINLRINTDKQNVQFIQLLLKDMDKRGILDNPKLIIAAAPVVGDDEYAVSAQIMQEFEKDISSKYSQLEDIISGRSVLSAKDILPALLIGEPVPRRISVCGATFTQKVFCPDHNIYSCWACIGRPDQVIGTYDNDGHVTWSDKILAKWRHTTVDCYPECLQCPYAFLCGGGCRRPAFLPNETAANAFRCDYYKNHYFDEYLKKAVDWYMDTN